MPLLGLGADLVDSQRVERLISQRENIFRSRILGCEEQSEISPQMAASRRVLAYAFSISAKEAFLKALGTGLAPGMRWPEIQMVDRHGHNPRLSISGGAARALRALGSCTAHLSLSCVRVTPLGSHALAVVVLSSFDGSESSL